MIEYIRLEPVFQYDWVERRFVLIDRLTMDKWWV